MDRLQRVIFKFETAEAEGLEPFEVILASDRDASAFASSQLYELFTELPEPIQKKIQVGAQFANALVHKPILFKEFARAHYGEYNGRLPWEITFWTARFDWFINDRLMPLARAKGLTLLFSELGDSVLIPKYACRVVSDAAEVMQFGEPQLDLLFGSKMLIANWNY